MQIGKTQIQTKSQNDRADTDCLRWDEIVLTWFSATSGGRGQKQRWVLGDDLVRGFAMSKD